MMRPAAENQVKADLLLDAVVKAENIEATDEDKKEFYDKLAADYGEDAEKIKDMIDETLMTQDIVRRKAADVMYSSAVKTEPKRPRRPRPKRPLPPKRAANRSKATELPPKRLSSFGHSLSYINQGGI